MYPVCFGRTQTTVVLGYRGRSPVVLPARSRRTWWKFGNRGIDVEKLVIRMHEINTARLRLRQWKDCDYHLFARINADVESMRFFAATLTVEESNDLAQYCRGLIEQQGWGIWAVEEKTTEKFIGFTGLHKPTDELPFTPCVEIAWRLAREAWGSGFATEAASAALSFAFDELALPEVVSFTALTNTPSERVMQRLGMKREPQTFLHPSLPTGHPLREHLLYRAYPDERASNFV